MLLNVKMQYDWLSRLQCINELANCHINDRNGLGSFYLALGKCLYDNGKDAYIKKCEI